MPDSVHSTDCKLFLLSQYSTEGKLKEPNLAAEAAQGLFGAVTSYARGDLGGVFTSVNTLFKSATTGRNATQRARATRTSPADCVRRFRFLLFTLLR
jgi:metacaspase-1